MSPRKRFFYNMNTCIGCGSCQVACKDSHNLLPDEYFRRAGMRSMRVGGEQRLVPFSISCNHCEHPACVAACPTGAMYITEDGLVLHNDNPCIGCGRCYWACPYGEVSFSKTSGYAQKCDTCLALREKGLTPACVAACPTECLHFGEYPPESGVLPDLPFLPDPSLTEPSLRIRKPDVLRKENEDGAVR